MGDEHISFATTKLGSMLQVLFLSPSLVIGCSMCDAMAVSGILGYTRPCIRVVWRKMVLAVVGKGY